MIQDFIVHKAVYKLAPCVSNTHNILLWCTNVPKNPLNLADSPKYPWMSSTASLVYSDQLTMLVWHSFPCYKVTRYQTHWFREDHDARNGSRNMGTEKPRHYRTKYLNAIYLEQC